MPHSPRELSDEYFSTLFADKPFLIILRGFSAATSVELAERAWNLGACGVEIPITTHSALDTLQAVIDASEEQPVGAGSITTAERVTNAVSLGASFAVSPGAHPNVLEACEAAKLPLLPGASTASEVQLCLDHGHRWIKMFPASELGTGWLKAMAGPFPDASFVATGGISAANASSFLAAGAHAVSFGSSFEHEATSHFIRSSVRR